MELIFTILVILAVSGIFTYIAKKLKIPSVVALILCGLILNIGPVRHLVIEPNTETIFGLGDFALICLMFIAGLESSWRELYKERKDSVILAIFAMGVPFIIGFFIFYYLGFSMIASFAIAICISITAEATKAKVLLEVNKLKSRVGAAMMGSGIVDDIIGLGLFIGITYILKKVYIKEDVLIGVVILSFFLGVFLQKNLGRNHHVLEGMEKTLMFIVIPFFFVSVGLHFDMGAILLKPFVLFIILGVAFLGKIIGVFLAKPLTKFNFKQLYLIGWAANSRGAVDMAIAMIAFRSSLIGQDIYSAFIIMALLTTLAFPLIVIRMIKKNPKIMD